MTAGPAPLAPRRVVLVCTGNTCRSALAEALLRRALEARGVTDVDVSSAGTGAWEGAPASEGAYLVGLESGLDLSGHRARLLTGDVVSQSDLILTMARHHRARVLELGAEGRVHLVGDFAGRSDGSPEVADPFGADLDVYRQTRDELAELMAMVAARLAEERRRARG
ncbi:MAG TPA: low molecular weight protein arginine phosphatase [Gemmatimonadales bacterium]|nr:low molecular weight protein arginine phosphatase [Gemmatimonadales bacterium]HRZ08966.1 low molecular weight protein arginine phosphatase [Gemmatimonadales bacterium]